MHADAPERPAPPAAAPAAVEAPPSTFTISGTGTAPPVPIRRGRGTFGRELRTEHMERRQQLLLQRDAAGGDAASSLMTSATSAVVLPSSQAHTKATVTCIAPEDEAAAPNAQSKRNIPLDHVYVSPSAALAAAAAAAAAAESGEAASRDWFGLYRDEAADTTRQLFFRGEKRKRYCMIVGNLQSVRRQVTLKLFGHRGLKPFKLQGKMIRLINLSVGRPRTRRALLNSDGTQRVDANGDAVVGEVEDDEEEDEQEECGKPFLVSLHSTNTVATAAGVTVASATAAGAELEPTAAVLEVAAAPAAVEDAEDVAARRRAHEAAGFPAEVEMDSEAYLSAGGAAAAKDAGAAGASSSAAQQSTGRVPPRGLAPIGEEIEGGTTGGNATTNTNGRAAAAAVASRIDNSGSSSHAAAATNAAAAAAVSIDDALLDGEEDVDHYFEREEDEVAPLTVQRADNEDGDGLGAEVLSLANSPVLTSKYFSSLNAYFLRELRFLLSLEDVRQQNVSVNVNLGAAYCCLARHGSHSTPLKHATFSQFVERMNDESMQLYFIKDCPACVSRAVDRECGALDHESAITLVKIYFFSNERQSRSIARAVWDSEKNAFKLLDMENIGVSFNWTIFSLDETLIRQRTEEAKKKAMAESPSAEVAAAAAAKAARAKSVAYPFEVEFRAFRRWRQHADHPAAPLAEAILEKLSTAEHSLISHGSSDGYEHLDLSNICELDYAAEDINVESITVEHTARVKPQGTDLLVDNTTSLFIENFAAARQLKGQVAQYGPEKTAARQNASNNNFLRGRGSRRGRGGGYGMSSGDCGMHGSFASDSEFMESVLRPASKLTFFRSRGSTIHWKFRLGSSVEENIAPMSEALRFVQQVLVTANDIERSSDRGGAAPEAL